MFEKLNQIEKRYLEIRETLCDPNIFSNNEKVKQLNKELSSLEEVYNLYQEYKQQYQKYNEAKEIIENETDEDLRDMAKQDLSESEKNLEDLQEKLKVAMLPKDPNDDKNIFLEIRPAAGGDEAGLFGLELMRMYLRYCEKMWWNTEIMEEQLSDFGGLKFAMIKASGESVFSKLKFESWVHRVQRVPETESWWRIHTSTVTVSVMPEVEDVEVHIDKNDIEMTTFAASSAWWQHANKNETWVRLHHTPTGIIVTISDSKSQLQNKEKAFNILRSKIYQIEQEKQRNEQKELKADQIGSWDRSEKIRTYNFPQDRITDHRIQKSWSNIEDILGGNIDDIINNMIMENQAKLLAATQQEQQ